MPQPGRTELPLHTAQAVRAGGMMLASRGNEAATGLGTDDLRSGCGYDQAISLREKDEAY